MSDSKSPAQLYAVAEQCYPDDREAQRHLYHDLMVQHGHLMEGKREPLPCGWSPSAALTRNTSTRMDSA